MPFNKKSLIFVLFLSLNLISITSYSKPSEKKSHSRRAYSKGRTNAEKVAYKIEVQLLPEESKLLGSTTIKWVNPTKIPVRSLRFHLFYNAFQNEKTTLLKELEFYRKSKKELDAYQFGEIKIKEMRIIEGEELTHKIKTISPDDQNPHDRTVMEVKLKDPVKPLQAITIKISYILMIPEIIDRTGRADDYFFMSLWYPKIGVLQQDGTWNCRQYHKDSGFFANFGTYQVAITLPEKFIIGATGNLGEKTKNADGTYTFVFKEKNIHSFTWVAYPHFKEIIEKISLKGNRTETKIVLLLPPHHRKEKQRYLDALKFSLQYYAENIFPYPYKKMTLVVPPYQAIKSANHSYPGLISLYSWTIIPRKFLLPERNTIQEFGHQYWHGIMGADKDREAWLDEGINTFFEMQIMEKYLGHSSYVNDSSLFGILPHQYHRWKYLSRLNVEKINQFSWKFIDSATYRGTVCSKAGILLQSLRNHLGEKRIMDFFRFYADKFKFQHPTTSDFIKTFNHFMGEDLSWVFEQFVNGNINLDHSVYTVKSTRINRHPEKYRNEIIFLRKEGYFPVELLIKLKDGKEIKYYWKERENWKKIILENDSPLEYAAIDPKFKILLDKNIFNNSKAGKISSDAITKIAVKFGFYFQNLLSFLFL